VVRIRLLTLIVLPALLAAAMIAAAGRAGDWLDDSPALLIGSPALVSAFVTFVALRRHGDAAPAAAAWSGASALSSALLFGIFLVVALAVDCAVRTTSCG
jgi:hypothetical protein